MIRYPVVQFLPFNGASRSSHQGSWAYSWKLGWGWGVVWPEKEKYGLFTLASCSPRPRGTSRSFSLSSLLPSSRTGIWSPTASCRTDHPSTERSLPGWCQTAGSQGCLESSRFPWEPSNGEWDSRPLKVSVHHASAQCWDLSVSPLPHSPSMQWSLSFHHPLWLQHRTHWFPTGAEEEVAGWGLGHGH